MHILLGDARCFIGNDKRRCGRDGRAHTLYASSCQGYGHGDMSLSIGLSTLMCIPAANWVRWSSGRSAALCISLENNARMRQVRVVVNHTDVYLPLVELRPISEPPSMLHRKLFPPPRCSSGQPEALPHRALPAQSVGASTAIAPRGHRLT
jgi:hypothetical protein